MIERISTGLPGFDRVLGGGLVRGSVVLIAGVPGVGKSTLLVKTTASAAERCCESVFASGEQDRDNLIALFNRTAASYARTGRVLVLGDEGDVDVIAGAASTHRASILVVDSINTAFYTGITNKVGGRKQVDVAVSRLTSFARRESACVLIVGHVSRSGEVAGPTTLQHLADAIVFVEGTAGGPRILRGGKNRFGPVGVADVVDLEIGGYF